MNYKNVGSHAEDTAEGAMVALGELTGPDFDPEADHNKRLLDEGIFIPVGEDVEPDATDAAVEAAKEHNIVLGSVTGTGLGGRITKEDVEREAAASGEESV